MLNLLEKGNKKSNKYQDLNTLEAIRLADEGMPISEIADSLGVPYHRVYRFFRSKDLAVKEGKKGGSSSPKCEHDVILAYARRYYSLSEISRIVGVTREAVRLILKKHGYPTDIRKVRLKDKENRVKTLINQGKSYKEIASDTELSYGAIRSIVKSLGVEPQSSTLTFDGNRAIKMSKDGYTVSEIAAALGTRYYNVLNFLRRRGVEIVGGHRGRLTFDPDKVKEMATEGMSLKRMAEHAGAKPHNLKLFLERHAVPYVKDWIPARDFQSEARRAREMSDAGKGIAEIAREMNYTQESVERLLGNRRERAGGLKQQAKPANAAKVIRRRGKPESA
jgi:DNA-binding CsgD family transcriptional regulator